MEQLAEVMGELGDQHIDSAIASSWIRNGDFWFGGSHGFTIDSSWLPKVEMATEWYDRVIDEFSGTAAAEVAYQRKLFVLLGWEDRGRRTQSYGLEENFGLIDEVVETFENFEEEFPDSSHLQGFRYQIGQAYWSQQQFDEARRWFERVVEAADGNTTFYSATAEQRLENLEY